jgi:hypothetical protein
MTIPIRGNPNNHATTGRLEMLLRIFNILQVCCQNHFLGMREGETLIESLSDFEMF